MSKSWNIRSVGTPGALYSPLDLAAVRGDSIKIEIRFMVRSPRLATPARILATLALATLVQGASAWAGPFNLAVYVYPATPNGLPTPSGDPGAIVLDVSFDMSVGPYHWDLVDAGATRPRNAQGEDLLLSMGDNNLSELYYEHGDSGFFRGVYWIWPWTPRGVFGGVVSVTGLRYDDDGNPVYATETAEFGFVVPGAAPGSAPEPAAAIPSLGGAALAIARRRRAS